MILFPAIDLKDGRCVRLKKGLMDQATVFNDDPAAQARQFQSAGFTNGLFRVVISGTTGAMVTIEASTDLGQWAPVVAVPMIGGSGEFIDPKSAQQSRRFYRLK